MDGGAWWVSQSKGLKRVGHAEQLTLSLSLSLSLTQERKSVPEEFNVFTCTATKGRAWAGSRVSYSALDCSFVLS